MSRLIDADKLKESIDKCDICDICPDKAIGCSYDCGFPDALDYKWEKLIDAQPTIEVPQWIPCSERLPEDSGDYLVRPSDNALDDYSEFEEIMIMPYDADCEAFGWWTARYDPISLGFVDSDFNELEVIAWMPLPKPYEETDHE